MSATSNVARPPGATSHAVVFDQGGEPRLRGMPHEHRGSAAADQFTGHKSTRVTGGPEQDDARHGPDCIHHDPRRAQRIATDTL